MPHKSICVIGCLLLSAILLPAAGVGPSSQTDIPSATQGPTPPGQITPPSRLPNQLPTPEDDTTTRMEKEMAKKANQQRQVQLKHDTEQLLKLANELKQYVDKSNEDILSVDVVKKADEIEKLAHSVKSKMRGSD